MTNKIQTMVIDTMIDNIIHVYGFEHPNTIKFCRIAETSKNFKLIKACYKNIMTKQTLYY